MEPICNSCRLRAWCDTHEDEEIPFAMLRVAKCVDLGMLEGKDKKNKKLFA